MGNKDDRRAAFSELCLDSWFELEIRNGGGGFAAV